MQPKLLRILEQRELKRLGANDFIKVNVRIIAATNRNITEEVRQGRFREDLYYRISVIKITLPPLRERKEDIPLLAKHFLKKSQNRVKIKDISPQAMECLMQYHWPGNLRQLSNVINQAVSLCKGDSIKIKDLPPYLFKSKDIYYDSLAANELSFKEAKRQRITSFERTYILDVLRRNNMNISRASRQAGLDRKYFKKLMRKYNILIPDKE
jgi:DNA-binding NtrC family response regulator